MILESEVEGMNLETEAYRKFTGPAEHHKAVNSFLGLLEGISIDGVIDESVPESDT